MIDWENVTPESKTQLTHELRSVIRDDALNRLFALNLKVGNLQLPTGVHRNDHKLSLEVDKCKLKVTFDYAKLKWKAFVEFNKKVVDEFDMFAHVRDGNGYWTNKPDTLEETDWKPLFDNLEAKFLEVVKQLRP